MNQFENVIKQGYTFEMGKYLDEGWKIFKKGAGSLIGFTVIYFIIAFFLNFIPFVGLFSSFILYPLIAGVYIFLRNQQKGKGEFNDFFTGYNYFAQVALFLLVLILFAIPLIILFITVLFPYELLPDIFDRAATDPEYIMTVLGEHFEENIGLFIVLYFVFLAGVIYLYISYSLVLPLISDAKLPFWQAMETSRKVVAKKFFSFFILYLLMGIIIMIGVLFTCGLGILVAIPFGLCVVFSVYDNILQPQSQDLATDISSFGQQQRDINTESEENKE